MSFYVSPQIPSQSENGPLATLCRAGMHESFGTLLGKQNRAAEHMA